MLCEQMEGTRRTDGKMERDGARERESERDRHVKIESERAREKKGE